MKTDAFSWQSTAFALALFGCLVPAVALAGDDPPFDFSDDFYRENGIAPESIVNRVNGADGVSVFDITSDPDRRNIRVIETTGGYEASGKFLYYNVFGMVMPGTFTDDAAGQAARELADMSRAFIFPKAGEGNPLSPAPGNRRQDNIFDTRHGYFSNNPLGLWILTFVSYTDAAFNTPDGQDELAKLASRHGLDLDETPIIRTVSELENLQEKGFVEFRTRAEDGSEGFPWVI